MEPEVKAKLERLHQQFDTIELDDSGTAHLHDLKSSVRQALDEPGGEHHLTLLDRLEQAIIGLDETYPGLSTAIRDAITVLTQSGV
ncbi:MAG TPA: DUF4404 family protein [Phototrophicaceae bacterium]|jgi:hypothetical protein|nr:DUF4404 family protein [Phototrophicaceae bacterium]